MEKFRKYLLSNETFFRALSPSILFINSLYSFMIFLDFSVFESLNNFIRILFCIENYNYLNFCYFLKTLLKNIYSFFYSTKYLYFNNKKLTKKFFISQPKKLHPRKLTRSFMGDVYGILDGVELGFGNAIMSKHLVKGHSNVVHDSRYKEYKMPVTLHYYEQPFYTSLFKEVRECLILNCKKLL